MRISGGFLFFFPLDDLCCFSFFTLAVVIGGGVVMVKMSLSGLRYLYLKYHTGKGHKKKTNNITL